MRGFIAFQLLVIVLLTSCNKDPLPESSTGEAAFVSMVNFNGEDFNFTAGENGIVLDPVLELYEDSVVFNSAFTNPSCPECGPELRMIIHSPDSVVPSFVTDWINELDAWTYEMEESGSEITFSLLGLSVNCGNAFSQGVWSLNGVALNNGIASNAIDFEVEEGNYSLVFGNNDAFCVDGGPRSINFDGESIPCYGSLSPGGNLPNTFVASPGEGFNPATTTYTWFADTLEIASSQDTTLTAQFAPDVDSLCVLIDDPFGCSVTECIAIPQFGTDCVTNLTVTESVLIDSTIVTPSFGAFVEIQFRDSQGNLYTSNNAKQENSQIELLSIESYTEPNMGATPFANVTYQVACTLYDASGNAFPFSGMINTALALPE
jgi:hypothetical protein